MKINLYSVRDEVGSFGQVFAHTGDASAKRDFGAAINNDKGSSPMSYAPQDFVLYRIGVFDNETGVIEPENIPVMIVRGSDLVGV